jgi:hypothetical protein
MLEIPTSCHGITDSEFGASNFYLRYDKREETMKIFVRERRKVDKGEKKPRFRFVGVSGGDIKIYVRHVRKKELDQLSASTGAEIVYLKAVKDGKGKRKGAASA